MDDLDRLALAAAREILLAADFDSQPNADADRLTNFETAKRVVAMLEETTSNPPSP